MEDLDIKIVLDATRSSFWTSPLQQVQAEISATEERLEKLKRLRDKLIQETLQP